MPKPAPLGGPQKVAAFLLTLPPDQVAAMLKRLEPDVVAEVAQAMEELDPTHANEATMRALYSDVARALHAKRGVRRASPRELQEVLVGGVGAERAEQVLGQIRSRRRQERPFLEIEGEPAERLAAVLGEESDAAAALVLAHLEPAQSAAVLGLLDVDRSLAIVRRMAAVQPPGFDVLRSLCETLRRRLDERGEVVGAGAGEARLRTIADLLNFASTPLEQSLLEGLGAEDAEMAKAIREHMFTWDDVADVDRRSMQKLLASVDTKTLSIALKGCDPAVEENVLANLSTRVREMVAEEREIAGAVPMSEVRAAREEILASVRAMIDAGEFKPSKGGEELAA